MLGDIFGAEFYAQGHAAHLPIVEFPAGAVAFALIERDADVGFDQVGLQFARGIENGGLFFVGLEDGDDNDLVGRELRAAGPGPDRRRGP